MRIENSNAKNHRGSSGQEVLGATCDGYICLLSAVLSIRTQKIQLPSISLSLKGENL
jgi:hypothetical protein